MAALGASEVGFGVNDMILGGSNIGSAYSSSKDTGYDFVKEYKALRTAGPTSNPSLGKELNILKGFLGENYDMMNTSSMMTGGMYGLGMAEYYVRNQRQDEFKILGNNRIKVTAYNNGYIQGETSSEIYNRGYIERLNTGNYTGSVVYNPTTKVYSYVPQQSDWKIGVANSIAYNSANKTYSYVPQMAQGLAPSIIPLTTSESYKATEQITSTVRNTFGDVNFTSKYDDFYDYEYNAYTNPGPLEKGNHNLNFYGGRYNSRALREDTVLYRAGESGEKKELG